MFELTASSSAYCLLRAFRFRHLEFSLVCYLSLQTGNVFSLSGC
uniref:Uncharacterized protein n=1 Tax=Tetraselmis sp. GSL018 TaxID=582737 RepID=A0A061RRQ8_9CHLO